MSLSWSIPAIAVVKYLGATYTNPDLWEEVNCGNAA
jgi:hypothetical protein